VARSLPADTSTAGSKATEERSEAWRVEPAGAFKAMAPAVSAKINPGELAGAFEATVAAILPPEKGAASGWSKCDGHRAMESARSIISRSSGFEVVLPIAPATVTV